jgi:predicted amidophosphoribosyltransferase
MRRLAEVAAGAIRAGGAPSAVVPALVVRGRRGDSVGLGAAARAANVSGTLAVRRRAVQRLRGALIVLVDDLVTTGATLGEAARVLDAAGVPASAAAVLAATERRAAAASSRSPSVSTSGRRPPRGGSES